MVIKKSSSGTPVAPGSRSRNAAKPPARATAAKKAPVTKAATAAALTKPQILAPSVAPIASVTEPVAASVVIAAPMLRKKELFERVVAMTGSRKRDVKPIVDATLQILGAALTAGESLALPPLGKAKVNRQKDLVSGEVLVIKLRRPGEGDGAANASGDALADEDE